VTNASQLSIQRTPLGALDTVTLKSTAFSDGLASYVEQAVTAVNLYDAATAGNLRGTYTIPAPGTVWNASQDLSASDGTSATRLSPARVWETAVDRAGNESLRVEITTGADTTAPTGDGNKMRFTRNPLGTADTLAFDTGAFTDTQSALFKVDLRTAAATNTAITATSTALTGNVLPTVNVGTATSAPLRV
jgi:hypothetical protein